MLSEINLFLFFLLIDKNIFLSKHLFLFDFIYFIDKNLTYSFFVYKNTRVKQKKVVLRELTVNNYRKFN